MKMITRILLIVLCLGGIVLLAVQFQSCAPEHQNDDYASSLVTPLNPNQVQGLKIWHKRSGDITLPAGPYISESMTFVGVLNMPEIPGTYFRYDDGTELSEGFSIQFSGIPVSSVSVKLAVFPNRVFNLAYPIVAGSRPVFVAVQIPKGVGDARSYLNGWAMAGNSSIVAGDSLTYLGRRINGNLDETVVTEFALFDRALMGSEVASLGKAMASRHSISLTYTEFRDVVGGSQPVPTYSADIVPIFQAHSCYSCHPGVQPAITSYTPAEIWTAVSTNSMPKNLPPLSASEKSKVSAWAQSGGGFN